MTQPADELGAAADKIRSLGRAAIGNGRPWRHAKGTPNDSVRTETGWEVAHGDNPNNLRYIAAMNPDVGIALADWLDETRTEVKAAEGTEYELHTSGGVFTSWEAALAVARAINGGQP
ncbi:hypothetical protein [Streptomyces prunicolor]